MMISTKPVATYYSSPSPLFHLDMSLNGPLAASVSLPDFVENGRRYHGYMRGIYMYPCDEPEMDRMDLYHELFLKARRGELHRAQIENNTDVRILDLGTGTGIWAMDMADKFTHAEVLGIDLANIQPKSIPTNLRFRVPQNYDKPSWSLGKDSFDLIHLRQGCGSIMSWPELYQTIFLHLKPGSGFIEQIEIDLLPRCDDGTLPPNSPVAKWYEYLQEATRRADRPVEYQHTTRQMLETTGFTDIQEQVIRAPFNSWPRDSHQKEIGRWYCLGLSEGLEALSMAPFTRVYGWSADTVRQFVEDVKSYIVSKQIHGYNNIHIWTARRPQQ